MLRHITSAGNVLDAHFVPAHAAGVRYTLKTFDIYVREQRPRYKAVKIGFSWPGFVFSWFWLIAKRMYLFGIILTLTVGVTGYALELMVAPTLMTSIMINLFFASIWFLIGFYGNRIWGYHLGKKGYTKIKSVRSVNSAEAYRQYLKENSAQDI